MPLMPSIVSAELQHHFSMVCISCKGTAMTFYFEFYTFHKHAKRTYTQYLIKNEYTSVAWLRFQQ